MRKRLILKSTTGHELDPREEALGIIAAEIAFDKAYDAAINKAYENTDSQNAIKEIKEYTANDIMRVLNKSMFDAVVAAIDAALHGWQTRPGGWVLKRDYPSPLAQKYLADEAALLNTLAQYRGKQDG